MKEWKCWNRNSLDLNCVSTVNRKQTLLEEVEAVRGSKINIVEGKGILVSEMGEGTGRRFVAVISPLFFAVE